MVCIIYLAFISFSYLRFLIWLVIKLSVLFHNVLAVYLTSVITVSTSDSWGCDLYTLPLDILGLSISLKYFTRLQARSQKNASGGGALPPDMDALNRHPFPHWRSGGYYPRKNCVRKIMQFCAFLQFQELFSVHVHRHCRILISSQSGLRTDGSRRQLY